MKVQIEFKKNGYADIEAFGFVEIATYLADNGYYLWDIKSITVEDKDEVGFKSVKKKWL